MPLAECPCKEMAMDFVVKLPESKGFNTIVVVTDCFTKVQQYIAAKTTWTVADITDAYINKIW